MGVRFEAIRIRSPMKSSFSSGTAAASSGNSRRAGNAVSLSAYLEERFEDRTRSLRMVSAAVT
ncbi:hypothetical protein ACWEN3_43305, partial [Streptomyces sp. NPDC004561]